MEIPSILSSEWKLAALERFRAHFMLEIGITHCEQENTIS